VNKMTNEKNYVEVESGGGAPIRAWVKGVSFEPEAEQQLRNAAQLPFIFRWIAAMPDVHLGIGATVGSVIPTKGAIIPAAVGVDIGCGMAPAIPWPRINLRGSVSWATAPTDLHETRTIRGLPFLKIQEIPDWSGNDHGARWPRPGIARSRQSACRRRRASSCRIRFRTRPTRRFATRPT